LCVCVARETLDRDGYLFFKDFLADVRLVFDNALLYNKGLKGNVNGEYEMAAAMMQAFEKEWGEISVHAVEYFERVRGRVRTSVTDVTAVTWFLAAGCEQEDFGAKDC
jgi:hypothetical protein